MAFPPNIKLDFVQLKREEEVRVIVRRVDAGIMSRRAERRSSTDSEESVSRSEDSEISESVNGELARERWFGKEDGKCRKEFGKVTKEKSRRSQQSPFNAFLVN
jgi:hypothetical protein